MAPAQVVLQATPVPGPGALPEFLPALVRLAWFLVGFVALVLVGWYVVEPAISRVIRRRNRGNPTLQEAISRYVRLVVVLVGGLLGVLLAGYGRWLAGSALVVAAATLALGVAAQAVIGSLVSGLVLVLDPEFNVGDYIEWAGGEGFVTSITLRVTRVETLNGEHLTIPNTVLTSQTLTRPFGRHRYRVVEHVAIAYEADVEAALDLLKEAAGSVDAVLDTPAPTAYVEALGPDAVACRVHYWLDRPRRVDLFAVRSAFARAAKRRLDEADITLSPPAKRELLGRVGVESDRDGVGAGGGGRGARDEREDADG